MCYTICYTKLCATRNIVPVAQKLQVWGSHDISMSKRDSSFVRLLSYGLDKNRDQWDIRHC